MFSEEDCAGSLARKFPGFVKQPPVESVVFAWGVNEDGQLGLDSVGNHLSPKVVESLLGMNFRGCGFGIEPIVTGSRGTFAISATGQLWSWGWNARATLGHGHYENVPKPSVVAGLSDVAVVQAAIGGWHSICVDDTGQMYAWGGNEYGQCGCELEERDVIVPRPILKGVKVIEVSAGGMHSLALTDRGEVLMWGERWGDFSLVVQREPSRVSGVSNIARISAGAFHNLALTRGGQVLAWGTNDFGQLGIGSTEYATDPVPVEDLERDIAEIRAGGWHSLAINKFGEVYTWGRGEYGRLGVGDQSGSVKLRPCHVSAMAGHCVVQASCGGTHTMMVTSEGRMFVTGRGSFGRLGRGTRDRYSPIEVELPGGNRNWKVISVAAGGRHSLCVAVPIREEHCMPRSVSMDRRTTVTTSTGSLADSETGEYLKEGFEDYDEVEEDGSGCSGGINGICGPHRDEHGFSIFPLLPGPSCRSTPVSPAFFLLFFGPFLQSMGLDAIRSSCPVHAHHSV